MGRLLTRATSAATLSQIRHVTPVPPAAAPPAVARVYAQVQRDFGLLAPPISLHSPAPGPLAAAWSVLRETTLVPGLAGRPAKEAVATAVSLSNACPYCVDVHGTTLRGLVGGRAAGPLADNRIDLIGDAGLRRLATWALRSGSEATAQRHPAPFPASHAPELLGVVFTFHYLNRMVNVFLDESPFPPGLPTATRRIVTALAGRLMRAMTRRSGEPGRSLALLPPATLPEDLAWASGDRHIAQGLARAVAAIEAAGRRSVPDLVRTLVQAELAAWRGGPRGPSRAWATAAVAGLPGVDRPAGRLALLTAFAPYQVDGSVIEEFRRDRPGDEALIELTSWASLAATRRAVSWLHID